jgi:putative thiamine transport system substrate-binding protein
MPLAPFTGPPHNTLTHRLDMTHQTSSPSETPQRRWNRRQTLAGFGCGVGAARLVGCAPGVGARVSTAWADTLRAARGQTVYFNAWAGSERINAYLQWAANELQRDFGVKLQHVKISDAADVVKRVRAEKQAGRDTAGQGTVDLVWINGENFAAMKREGLLSAPFAQPCPTSSGWTPWASPPPWSIFRCPPTGWNLLGAWRS